jgi:hypothetical protein
MIRKLYKVSGHQIIVQTGIPHSTAYRKIKWMINEGLLFVEKIELTQEGKKFSLVRTTLKSINVNYNMGQITIQVDYNINALEKTAERLFLPDPDYLTLLKPVRQFSATSSINEGC